MHVHVNVHAITQYVFEKLVCCSSSCGGTDGAVIGAPTAAETVGSEYLVKAFMIEWQSVCCGEQVCTVKMLKTLFGEEAKVACCAVLITFGPTLSQLHE